jgi:hypothetical protein
VRYKVRENVKQDMVRERDVLVGDFVPPPLVQQRIPFLVGILYPLLIFICYPISLPVDQRPDPLGKNIERLPFFVFR